MAVKSLFARIDFGKQQPFAAVGGGNLVEVV
jgi:hypothetical protein